VNYGGIALLCKAYKVFANILCNRLEPITERIIGEYQTGFRPGTSKTGQLFTLKQTLEKCWEYNLSVYQIYVEFRQAYDSIQRKKLYTIMYEFGLPPKLVRLVRVTMTGTEAQVKFQSSVTHFTGTIKCTLLNKSQQETILKFYKVLTVPPLLCGCERWILTKQQLQEIESSEMIFLISVVACRRIDKRRKILEKI
jgi:hypothetical protein